MTYFRELIGALLPAIIIAVIAGGVGFYSGRNSVPKPIYTSSYECGQGWRQQTPTKTEQVCIKIINGNRYR